MTQRLFYTDHHVLPLPPQHKFPIEKYRMLRELLTEDGFFRLEAAPLAGVATIALAHDAEYVDAILKGTLSDGAMRRIGFPWSEGLVRRTLASVGSTLAATREALVTGWGGTLAGGTHHAFAGEGSGFCVFNDIAVAARWVLGGDAPVLGRAVADSSAHVSRGVEGISSHLHGAERETLSRPWAESIKQTRTGVCAPHKRVERVAVIDLDVHQGDGTAHIFREDAAVMTVSVHCKNNFPLHKQRSSLDVELEAGAGDEEYLPVLAEVLPRVWEFRPGCVFYQSGVDGLVSDRLGRLRMSHAGLMERDRMVMRGVRELGVPLVITMGGGYSEPIALTALAHANTFRTAAEVLGGDASKS